ncbi:MAG: DNA alkylation repair protein [Lachnospiraceae bacterium]|nr:DNA alkylation repair protein [Lachnospiraceae bacterium]
MTIDDIQKELFALRDEKYASFQKNLIPTESQEAKPAEEIIGVRTPALRDLAKRIGKQEDISLFLDTLPHRYFDENQLHAFIISGMKDYDACMARLQAFLPYVDNWATCDQMSPKIFAKHKSELLGEIRTWIASKHTYTVRFAIKMLMEHFLAEDFDLMYPEMVAQVVSDEYYVNMMIAWYFATALAKQYDAILPFIEQRRLADWTHKKTIQKAIESYRITDEQKAYLRSLK